MARLTVMLMILVVGAVILAPIVMMIEPDPLPGDFVLAWNSQHYPVPVLWSLCASGALALLYLFYRR
jgi:RsiW-degrading membrane proteinase PrsW (M82 family)